MAKLGSVHVGMPKDVAGTAELCTPGLENARGRAPNAAPAQLDGDGQGDLDGHGGENRAVLGWCINSTPTSTG